MKIKEILEDIKSKINLPNKYDRRSKLSDASLVTMLIFFFKGDREGKRSLQSLRRLIQDHFQIRLSRGGF